LLKNVKTNHVANIVSSPLRGSSIQLLGATWRSICYVVVLFAADFALAKKVAFFDE
jgi:hypothetical protein